MIGMGSTKRKRKYTLIAPPGWMIDSLLQCSLRMRPRLRTTPKPHPLTNIISSFLTSPAFSTRLANLERYAVAHGKRRDFGTQSDDDAGGFVA